MHRWFWYSAGVYLAPSRLTSALLAGLTLADMAYTAQTVLFDVGPLVAFGTATVVFKTAGVAAYLLS